MANITITGISPNKGSVNGNTKLVITGTNLNYTSAYVSIGDYKNACKIISMTNTEITCITHKYKAGSAKIMLTIRGTDNAICHDSTDNCKFTYDEAITPMITDAYKEIYK